LRSVLTTSVVDDISCAASFEWNSVVNKEHGSVYIHMGGTKQVNCTLQWIGRPVAVGLLWWA